MSGWWTLWEVSLIICQTLVCEDKLAANYWCVPGYEYTVRVWHDVRMVDFVGSVTDNLPEIDL